MFSCKSTNELVIAPPMTEMRDLDTLVVKPDLPLDVKSEEDFKLEKYNPSYERVQDLLHTKLVLSFDWEKEHVNGSAYLSFTPVFYPSDQLVLDAVGFDIASIRMSDRGPEIPYKYDGKKIVIQLPRKYEAGEKYNVIIDYVAKPGENEIGGSAAITSDKGLFFINAQNEDPNKPMQIWTQGETENNSRWFPTIDKPNERCTQEVYLTVEDRFTTLSNGVLVSSNKNSDGTRTDYWKMNLPHAPYLFMLAIGEFSVTRDNWRGKELGYYVEPEYESSAKMIFNHTPEMLTFFSDVFGVDYPWDKYSQVVVRDYVSGAMENTTAVIFGEFVQRDSKSLADYSNDDIVAHEMAHHWFGDLATCESWSNLTMNEGFASYSEILWDEYKYGKDKAEQSRSYQKSGYIQSTQGGATHDLIHFGYDDKESMFDSHSYSKGSLVLHMLRKEVGDDAFFTSLNKFLVDNAYRAVEAHDLRLAFEEVTGKDLNWFFNQWFFDKGHPELDIKESYEFEQQKYTISVAQTQKASDHSPIFILPTEVKWFYADGSSETKKITIDQRRQEFSFEAKEKPVLLIFDSESALLADVNHQKSDEAYALQFKYGENYLDKKEALNKVVDSDLSNKADVLLSALEDPFYEFVNLAIANLDVEKTPSALSKIENLLASKDLDVRKAALRKLAKIKDPKHLPLLNKTLKTYQSYGEYSAALNSLFALDKNAALLEAKKQMNSKNTELLNPVAGIFAKDGSKEFLSFFTDQAAKASNYDSYGLFQSMHKFLAKTDGETALKGANYLKSLVLNTDKSNSVRYMSALAINSLKNNLAENNAEDNKELITNLASIFSELIEKEQNERMKAIFSNMLRT